MNTKEKLKQALKDAMKSKDALKKRVVRMALTSIKNAEIAKGEPLDESEVLAILQKEVKARRETIEGAEKAGRDEMIAEAEAEIEFLEQFLPQPLTSEELEAIVREVIDEIDATSPRDIGKVMGALMPRIRGRADGGEASSLVQKILRS
jgi:uncharacterized protein YqeY